MPATCICSTGTSPFFGFFALGCFGAFWARGAFGILPTSAPICAASCATSFW
jgi:hypothetical protein